jgi:hypothetical protein
MSSGILDEYYPFPEGKWLVEIQGVEVMGFEGHELHPTEFGLFMTHTPLDDNQEVRHSFVPWSRVKRAYTVREP